MSASTVVVRSRVIPKWPLLGGSPLLVFACQNAEVRACQEQLLAAQQSVLAIDPKSQTSVAKSLSAVESSLATCERAQRGDAVRELSKAKNELLAQKNLLERRARRKPRVELTADDLRGLEKEGDPSCPRGQAYRHRGSKEIRCMGPQLVEMNARQASSYFEERDYRVRTTPPATLDIERGSERILLVYEAAGSEAPPVCIKLYPPPETTWQESLARASGANPARLKISGTLETARGTLPYSVDEKNTVIRVGQCAL